MNNETIKHRFLYYKTQAAFDLDLENEKVDDNSIVFIEDSSRVWTHGTYFLGGSGSGNIPLEIPKNVSAFINDAGYLTQHQDISHKANISDLASVAFSGNYNDLSNRPNISTKTSQLTNDSGFITAEDVQEINIEGKADKVYVDQELVKKADKTQLDGLATEQYVTAAIAEKADKSQLIGLATETYVNNAVSGKVDANYVSNRLVDYYTKSQTYSKEEVDALIPDTYTKSEIDVLLPQIKLWRGTQVQYDAIVNKDADTLYVITD